MQTGRAYDVVVAGSGCAGMTAALILSLKGLRVLVVEKDAQLGGTTAISGGGIWAPANGPAARRGISDSLEAASEYVEAVIGQEYDKVRMTAFLKSAREMIECLERDAGIGFIVAADRPDYYPDQPGATEGGRMIMAEAFDARRLGSHIKMLRPPARETTFLGMMMRPASDLKHFLKVFRSIKSFGFVVKRLLLLARDTALHGRSMDLAGGNALIAHLLEACLRTGVDFEVKRALQDLVIEDGAVTGAILGEGATSKTVSVARGVVLATGGFPHDAMRRAQRYLHAPSDHEHLSPAPKTNTGDGLRIGERHGGYVPPLTDPACWAPVSRVRLPSGEEGVFPHLIDRQKPGFIAVTADGKRFVNESHSYHEFGRGLRRVSRRGEAPACYLIADHRAVRRYGIGFAKPAPLPLFPYIHSGYVVAAPSIDELAARTGINADNLRQTISRFNASAVNGEDPEFGRGTSSYQRYTGDAAHSPNSCVAPIIKPPFCAVRIELGELGTFEGLAVDANARVLRLDGSPIAGLYAVGNDSSHVMAGHYIGGGAAIGPAMTFGYLAALHLAHRDLG
jgi:succinate dehydrogenase/fumarate reductase flavoprotein subunit